MKFDTVLRACLKRTYDAAAGIGDPIKVRRQQGTFRTWLVRHDERNKMRIAELEKILGEHIWRVTIMAPVPEPPPFDEGVE